MISKMGDLTWLKSSKDISESAFSLKVANGVIAPELDLRGMLDIFSRSEAAEDAEDNVPEAVPDLFNKMEGKGGKEPRLKKASGT